MYRALTLGLGSLLLVLVAGCSEYVDNYQYEPHPALVQTVGTPAPPPANPVWPTTQPQPAPPYAQVPAAPLPPQPVVSSYVSIEGVYRGNEDEKIPPSVEVRLRIENRGPPTIVFDPATFELLDGGLRRFQPAIVRPPQRLTISPGQAVVFDVFFPFVPGHSWENTDLEMLRATWQVMIDGHSVSQSAEFHRAYYRRVYRSYYGPYWDDPYDPYYYPHFYGGVVVVHRRW